MLNSQIQSEYKKGLDRVREKYRLSFEVEIVDGQGASINGNKISIGKRNPLKHIQWITVHECYHVVLQINQTKDFQEKDAGDLGPINKLRIRYGTK